MCLMNSMDVILLKDDVGVKNRLEGYINEGYILETKTTKEVFDFRV